MKEIDWVSLGRNIRELRQEKKMTLKELSSGIFSISKMSYFENGTGTLTEDELKEVCEKLNVNYERLINEVTYGVEEQDPLEELESHLFLGFYSSVSQKIKEIEIQLSQEPHNIDIFRYLYICGEYYYLINQPSKSIEILNKIGQREPTETKHLKYLHRSYNLISTIYYEKNNYPEALVYIEKALNIPINTEELWKTEFNAAILYALEGEYRMSTAFLNRIKKKSDYLYLSAPKVKYLLFIIDILEGNIKSPSEYNKLMKYIREVKDYELISRTSLIRWHFHSDSRPFIEETFELELQMIIENKQMTRGYETVLLDLLHSFTLSYFNEKNYEKALKYIDKAYILKKHYPNLEKNYFTYYLHAQILSRTEPENQKQQLNLYFKALGIIQNTDVFSYHKGVIYYELNKLMESHDNEDKQQKLALNSLYTASNNYFKRIQVFSYFLPNFLY